MTPIEEEPRATFERHEVLTPAVGPVRAGIEVASVRARRRRTIRRVAGAAVAVLMAGSAVPVILDRWQHGSSPSVPTAEFLAAEPAPAGALDVLLLGSDNRLRWQDRNRRADTVMIIHVPADTQLFLRALVGKLAADGTVTDPARVHALLTAARDGLEITGDPAALLRVAGSLSSPGSPIGISERTFHGMANGREQIYARVGPSLYTALRDDTLPTWIAANPAYVVK